MAELRTKIGGVVIALGLLVSLRFANADSLPATRPAKTSSGFWIPSGFHVVRDIPYVLHGRRSQMLDIYLPDAAPTSPRPLMVWIHGGAWISGDKSAPPGMGLLLRGFIVASINYRLSGEAVFPAQIFDCKAAVRFLRAHAREFGIDSTRICVWGDSAGGHLAALMGTTNGRTEYEGASGNANFSSAVQAVCDWYGPSDFLQTADIKGTSAAAVKSLFGNLASARSDIATFASPAFQAGRAPLVPFLIMHGELDSLVPVHQSLILFQKLQAAGANSRLVILPKVGHGNGWFRNRDDLYMVYDFFDRCFHTKTQARAPVTTRPST